MYSSSTRGCKNQSKFDSPSLSEHERVKQQYFQKTWPGESRRGTTTLSRFRNLLIKALCRSELLDIINNDNMRPDPEWDSGAHLLAVIDCAVTRGSL